LGDDDGQGGGAEEAVLAAQEDQAEGGEGVEGEGRRAAVLSLLADSPAREAPGFSSSSKRARKLIEEVE
jgi:hypothetical protein